MKTAESYLTPPTIAKRYGVNVDKVLGWIRRGELRAINVADRAIGRPRWRISEQDLRAFEDSRAAFKPSPSRAPRKRREDGPIKEYF